MFWVTFITGDTVKTHAHTSADTVYYLILLYHIAAKKTRMGVNPCITYQPAHLFIHPTTHLLSIIYRPNHPSIHNRFIYSLIYPSIHPFIHHLSIHSYMCALIHESIHPLLYYPSIHPSTHLHTHSPTTYRPAL